MTRHDPHARDARHPYALRTPALPALLAWFALGLLMLAALAAPLLTLAALTAFAGGLALAVAIRRLPLPTRTLTLRTLRLRVTLARPADE